MDVPATIKSTLLASNSRLLIHRSPLWKTTLLGTLVLYNILFDDFLCYPLCICWSLFRNSDTIAKFPHNRGHSLMRILAFMDCIAGMDAWAYGVFLGMEMSSIRRHGGISSML
jgi:hypothetical protein